MSCTDNSSFSKSVFNLTRHFLDIWWNTSTEFPPLTREYGFLEKKRFEADTNRFIDRLISLISELDNNDKRKSSIQYDIKELIRNYAVSVLGFAESQADILFSEGYTAVTQEFIKKSRQFNPQLEVFDIFQAMRNVWIMNSIQLILGKDISFSPSIFAYSMLYPYSDNYLDDPCLSEKDKLNFNTRFQERLLGNKVSSVDKHETDIYSLIEMIEGQYPRHSYPDVWESLLAIHSAQNKSLVQQKRADFPFEGDIIGISFEKGGTSVLADGCLVSGCLSSEEASFMFGYGVFFQLADDLQDIQNDLKNGHMTIFSSTAGKWILDSAVSRLFHFMKKAVAFDDQKSFHAVELTGIIEFSCKYLIFEAVAKNTKYFSRKFIKRLQKHSPLSFHYHRRLRKKFRRKFSSIDIEKLCSALASADAE